MRLIETQDVQGIASSQRITFEYDIFDRLIVTRHLNSSGGAMAIETITFSDVFNAAGDSRIQVHTHGSVHVPGITTLSHYDRFGRRTQEGTIGGRIITYTHDLAGRVTREQSLGIDNTFTHSVLGVTAIRNIEGRTSNSTYDGLGRLLTMSDFAGNVQRFSYDNLGRLISQRTPFERIGNVIQYSETRYFYDRNGNLTRTSTLINAPGTAQRWADTVNTFRHNRLISSQTGGAGAEGIRVDYTYDLAGNILTMSNGGAITSYTYNNRGQLTQIRDPLGQIESFTYDANGLVLTRTDRNGTQFQMTYDNMGRLVRENAVRNGVVTDWRTNAYHPTGAIHRQATAGHEIVYLYDPQGRLIRQEETGGIVTTHQYNAANNVTQSRTYVNGGLHVNNTYTFDSAQRIHIARTHGLAGATHGYDANGNRIRTTAGNGVVTDYTFNLANLATSVTNRHGNNVLSRFDYLHYLDGNVRQITEPERTVTYTYDLARRLVREEVIPTTPMANSIALDSLAEGLETHGQVARDGSLFTDEAFGEWSFESPGTPMRPIENDNFAESIWSGTEIPMLEEMPCPCGAEGCVILMHNPAELMRRREVSARNASVATPMRTIENSQFEEAIWQETEIPILEEIPCPCGADGCVILTYNSAELLSRREISARNAIAASYSFLIEHNYLNETPRVGTEYPRLESDTVASEIHNVERGYILEDVACCEANATTFHREEVNYLSTATLGAFESADEVVILYPTDSLNQSATITAIRQGDDIRLMMNAEICLGSSFLCCIFWQLPKEFAPLEDKWFIGNAYLPWGDGVAEPTEVYVTSCGMLHMQHWFSETSVNISFDVTFRTLRADTWEEISDIISEHSSNTLLTIQISDNITAPNNASGNAIVIPANQSVLLVSTNTIDDAVNVRTLTQTNNNQRHFRVYGNLRLSRNITLSGGIANNLNNSGGVEVRPGGALTMLGGSVIENCHRTDRGGAVDVVGSGTTFETRATFNMQGGIIRNNSGTIGGGVNLRDNSQLWMFGLNTRIEGNLAQRGGGVAMTPTGNAFSSLQLTGGLMGVATITGNRATEVGGGVYVAATMQNAFRMSGGNITNNTADQDGGGIYTTQSNNSHILPATAYRNLNISAHARFYGNMAGNGSSSPPDNRLTHIATTASTSIWDYVLNNYDINYRGRLTHRPAPEGTAVITLYPIDPSNQPLTMTVTRQGDDTRYVMNAEVHVGYSYLCCILWQMPAGFAPIENKSFMGEVSVPVPWGDGRAQPLWVVISSCGMVHMQPMNVILEMTLNINFDVTFRTLRADTWEDIGNIISEHSTDTILTIQLSDNINAPNNASGNAILIPANQNVLLVSTNTAAGAGNVRTLTQTNNTQRHFRVYGNLRLGQNITLSGGAANNLNNSGGIEVRPGGTLTMLSGSVIENCRRTDRGGAVDLVGSGILETTRATFSMSGGTIRNNSGTIGGGVNLGDNSQFRMSGLNARLEGNLAQRGGGVAMPPTENVAILFQLSGGTITGNRATEVGGGVYVAAIAQDVFWMFGGSITNNAANQDGGGIYTVQSNDSQVVHVTAYRNLRIGANARFYGNRAGNGSSRPPDNRLPNIATTASTSVWEYALNNYDINYRGRLVPVHEVRTYTFDIRGNRRTRTVTRAESYTVTYSYDLNNRLLSTTRTGSNPSVTTFTYDRNGNQLASFTGGQTETRTYNAFNQLTGVTSPGMTATYSYRAEGLRRAKTVNGVVTQHVWNGMHIVAELNANGVVISRFDRDLNGRLMRSTRHGWYLFNARGDVVQLTNANGVVTRTYRYDAFGNEIGTTKNGGHGSTGSVDSNPFRFAGMYWDAHTQTYMTPNRHFNPRTGRWTQPDPFWNISNMQGSTGAILQAANLYVFVTNNPIMFVDPRGLYRVNFVDYVRAMGATVNNIGQEMVSVTYGGRTQNWALNSGYMQDYAINAHFGWSSFLTQADRNHGVGIVITGGNLYRNVTAPVNAALAITANHSRELHLNALAGTLMNPSLGTARMTDNLVWFYGQVNHLGPWDIKEPNSWERTIGSTHPGRTWTGNGFLYQPTYF